MAELKRYAVKYIRDKAKSAYEKGSACEICGVTEQLDFHHFNSLSPLVAKWIRQTGLKEEDVQDWREDFIAKHISELYDETVTLCHDHHLQLHSVYGRNPSLATAKKQANWVKIQREKHGLA